MLRLIHASRATWRVVSTANSTGTITAKCAVVKSMSSSSSTITIDDWRLKIKAMRLQRGDIPTNTATENSASVFQNLESFSGKGLNAVDVCEAIAAVHGIGLKWGEIDAASKNILSKSSVPLMQSMNADELAAYVWGLGDLRATWGSLPGDLQKGLTKAWKEVNKQKMGKASRREISDENKDLVAIARDGLVRIGAPDYMVRKAPIFSPETIHEREDYPSIRKNAAKGNAGGDSADAVSAVKKGNGKARAEEARRGKQSVAHTEPAPADTVNVVKASKPSQAIQTSNARKVTGTTPDVGKATKKVAPGARADTSNNKNVTNDTGNRSHQKTDALKGSSASAASKTTKGIKMEPPKPTIDTSGIRQKIANLLKHKERQGSFDKTTAISIQNAIKSEVPTMDKAELLTTVKALAASGIMIYALPEFVQMKQQQQQLSHSRQQPAQLQRQANSTRTEGPDSSSNNSKKTVAVASPSEDKDALMTTPSPPAHRPAAAAAAAAATTTTTASVLFDRLVALVDEMNGDEIVLSLNALAGLGVKWNRIPQELVLAVTGEKLASSMLFESKEFSAPLLEILRELNALGVKWYDLPEATRAAILKRITIDAHDFTVKNTESSIPLKLIAAGDSRTPLPKSGSAEPILPPPPPPPPTAVLTSTGATPAKAVRGGTATVTSVTAPTTEFFKGKFLSTSLYYLLSMDFNFVRDADQEMRMKAILSVEDCALRGMLTQLTASKILYSLGKLNVTWEELSAPEQETLKNVLKCCLAETNLWDLMEGLQGAARMKMPITNQMWYSMENTIVLALKGDLDKKPTQNETKTHAQLVATNVSVLLWSLATILRMPSPSNTASQQSPSFSSTSTSMPSSGETDSIISEQIIDSTNTRTIRLEDELLIGEELQSVLHAALLKTLPDTDYGRFAITIWSLGKLRVGSKIMADFQLRVALEDAIYKLVPLMDSLNLSNLLHGLGFLDVKFKSLLPSSRKVILEGLHRQSIFMNAKDVFGILRGFAFMGVRGSDLPPETDVVLRNLINTHSYGFSSSKKYINMIYAEDASGLRTPPSSS